MVRSDSYRQMTAPAPVAAGFTAPYGFGLSLIPLAGRAAVSHTGVVAGYTSMVASFPEDDLIVVVLTNRRHAWVHHIVKSIARAALDLPPPLLRHLPIPEDELARYVGTYDDGLFTIRVFTEAGRPLMQVEELGPPYPLLYQGDSEFATAGPEGFRLWLEPADEHAERVRFEWLELHSFGRRVR